MAAASTTTVSDTLSNNAELKPIIAKLNDRIFTPEEIKLYMLQLGQQKFNLVFQVAEQNKKGGQAEFKIAYYNLGLLCEMFWKSANNGVEANHALRSAFIMYLKAMRLGILDGKIKVAEYLFFRAENFLMLWIDHTSQNVSLSVIRSTIHLEAIKLFDEIVQDGNFEAKFWVVRELQNRWQNFANNCDNNRRWRSQAFSDYHALAQQDHAGACAELGWCYEHNVTQDFSLRLEQRQKLALHYYRRSSELGSVLGLSRFARLYKEHCLKLTNSGDVPAQSQNGISPQQPVFTLNDVQINPQSLLHLLLKTLTSETSTRNLIPKEHDFSSMHELQCTIADYYMDNFGMDPEMDLKARMEAAVKILQSAHQENVIVNFYFAKWHLLNLQQQQDHRSKVFVMKSAIRHYQKAKEAWQGMYSREAAYAIYQLYTLKAKTEKEAAQVALVQQANGKPIMHNQTAPEKPAGTLASLVSGIFFLLKGGNTWLRKISGLHYDSPLDFSSCLERNEIIPETTDLETFLDYAADAGHPQALRQAIQYYCQAALANRIDGKLSAEDQQQFKMELIEHAFHFYNFAKLRGVPVADLDTKILDETYKTELVTKRTLIDHLNKALVRKELYPLFHRYCKQIEREWRAFEEGQLVVQTTKPKTAPHTETTSDSKSKQENKKTAENNETFEQTTAQELKTELTLKLKAIYEAFVKSHRGLFKAYYRRLVFLPPEYLASEWCMEEVLRGTFEVYRENKLRMEALLQGLHLRMGRDSAAFTALRSSPMYVPNLLTMRYDTLAGTTILKADDAPVPSKKPAKKTQEPVQ